MSAATAVSQAPPPRTLGLRGRPAALPQRWPATVLGLVAAVLAWFRVSAGQTDNLHAEDGVLFLHDWAVGGHLSVLWQPYDGYQHLIPRVVSALVSAVVPIAWWGVTVTAIACGIVGTVAALVFLYSADIVAYYPARIALGLITVLIPIAGIEPLGNLANIHWFLLYLMPWLLMATPRSRSGLIVATALALVATLTEPQCLIFAPLALWRFVTVPAVRPVPLAWAVGIAAQAVSYLTSPRPHIPGRPPVMSIADGYVLNVGLPIITSRAHLIGAALARWGWWVGFAWVIGLLLFAAVGFSFGRTSARVMLVALVLGSAASWCLSYVVNNIADLYYSGWTADRLADPTLMRWGTAASMMLAATIPITVGVLVERFPTWWPAAIAALSVFVGVMAVDLTHRVPVDGSTWSSQITAAQTACDLTPDGDITLYIQPYPVWVLGMPCSVIDG